MAQFMNRRQFVAKLAVATTVTQTMKSVHCSDVLASDVAGLDAFATQEFLVHPKVEYRAELFPLQNIRLLDGPFARQQEINRQYLLKLEPDRLLSLFRREAELEPKAPPYRGWESEPPNLNGHILGFYMSGAGMMVQATGDSVLKERLNYIVEQLAEVQDANGSGYLLPVPDGKKLFHDVAAGNFTITNASKTYGYQINGVFEPTYTWNKITLGLFEVYKATGNPRAKQVLLHTADWFGHDVIDKLSDEQVQTLLFCEHGSIHESMVDAYLLSQNPKYLKWARRLCFERMLKSLEEGNGDFLDGYHANCSIPVYTGAERVFDYNGEEHLDKAATNFLEEVVHRRSWVIGGNSASEHFFPPADFEKAIHEPAGPESCNSVNMLRLMEATFRVHPSAEMMDHYERILWNHLLAVHDPERGMFAYYTPLEPGTYRVYSDEFDSMWCCVGTGLECPGKYGQMIYSYRPDKSDIDVNLFIASRLTWPERGISIRQDTQFPEESSTALTIEKAPREEISLRIRHPWWIPEGKMTLTLNGEKISSTSKPGEYAEVSRVWSPGDKLGVELPMQISVESLPNSKNYFAFLYGPIVLSGALGRDGLTKYDFWSIKTTVPTKRLPEDRFPRLVASTPENMTDKIKLVSQRPLIFQADTTLMNMPQVKLIPFYQNHFQRYVVYWRTIDS